MQVVGGMAAPRGISAERGAWGWLTTLALRARIRGRPPGLRGRLDGPEQRSAIANHEPHPDIDSSSQQMGPPGAQAMGGAHPDDARDPHATAFDRFYTRHEQALYGYLRRMLPSNELAVELAQETFFRAWRHFDQLSGYDRPEAWLYRVATNLAISQLRRRRPVSFSSLFASARAEGATDDDGLSTADLLASPLDVEGQTAERDTIDRALRRLPERQRAALLLAAAQGFTADEIAAALGVRPDNARQILSRARESFRRHYDSGRRALP